MLRATIDKTWPARWLPRLARFSAPSTPLAQALDLHEVLAALQPLAPQITQQLGARPWCITEQCWLRRGRPPHSWHQDGALHLDFMQAPKPAPGALLPMLTCWIALSACGETAPGLEWLEPALEHLLSPSELEDAAIARRFPPHRHARVRPVLAPGDALIFGGGLLHRTHLTPTMHEERISIELRFCAHPAPPRLARYTLLTLNV